MLLGGPQYLNLKRPTPSAHSQRIAAASVTRPALSVNVLSLYLTLPPHSQPKQIAGLALHMQEHRTGIVYFIVQISSAIQLTHR
jgi:hypothetical protein